MKRATGRPRRRDQPVRVHVRISRVLDLWLRRYAAEVGRTRGEVIEQALVSFRDASASNALRHRGLAKSLAEHLRRL